MYMNCMYMYIICTCTCTLHVHVHIMYMIIQFITVLYIHIYLTNVLVYPIVCYSLPIKISMALEITRVVCWRQVTSDRPRPLYRYPPFLPASLHVVSDVTNQVSKLMVPNPTKHIVADVQVRPTYCIVLYCKVIHVHAMIC